MRVTKRLIQAGALTAVVAGAVAALTPETAVGRAVRRAGKRLRREGRYAVASAPGMLYHLAGRHPDPNVTDDILADRIRSSLGPLERRLDVPHIHVMVDQHVAILHGEVGTEHEAKSLEHAAMGVSGVAGVESHLHRGLTRGDTRPSEGVYSQPPSAALLALVDSARAAGAHEPIQAVHAVLCGFGDRIPHDERLHVLAHLPFDVRELTGGPRRLGVAPPRVHTVPQLIAAVVAVGGIEPDRAEAITRAVIATLRTLVPEETADVASVLAPDLQELWNSPRSRQDA